MTSVIVRRLLILSVSHLCASLFSARPSRSGSPLAVAGAATALILAVLTATPSADNWPEWRGGPKRDGRSAETGLPAKWTPPSAKLPAGENLAWRVPIGSRSTPVVFGNRLYLLRPGRRRRAPRRSAWSRSTPTPARWSGRSGSPST